jgi:ferrochelatase
MRTGILLLNLGGPDSLEAVRPFLYNLFSDREIIQLGPPFMQKPIAWLISTMRSSKSRNMYRQIGGRSPILDITKAQAVALEKALNQGGGTSSAERRASNDEQRTTDDARRPTSDVRRFKVYIGMRYWRPFIGDTVQDIIEDGIEHLIVLTLYPHYSKTTTGSSVNDFKSALKSEKFNVKYIEEWYDFPTYIDALAELIAEGVSEFKGHDFTLLYSAHNLPTSFINGGDPYLDHIKNTIQHVNARLSDAPYSMKELKWSLAFQSKSGPVEWLEPSTDETIIKMAGEGVKNIFIVPISFVSDHIETLYEIDILFKELANKHGINLKRCRSLNTSDKFIHALKELVLSEIEKV